MRPRLIYYDARGTCLRVRLMLADLGVEYDWVPLSDPHALLEARGKAPCGSLPIWEEGGGALVISGANTILEYLGARLSVQSDDLQVRAVARELEEYCNEYERALWGKRDAVAAHLAQASEGTRSEANATYDRNRLIPMLVVLGTTYQSLRRLLARPLPCDYALLEVLHYTATEDPDLLGQVPTLQDFYQDALRRPRIKKFVSPNTDDEGA
ncbi:Glutathione S-transferase-like protein [Giardia muris]|uniref:Glutathione S-transferase-like protein n=1 Tax=Giardia muris TaxID=5742 RepID=A0A4Z1SNR9_GIAMU|nr:Glutathione S-transferase-like protein [Giardia muris]|eukprot:TNJ27416.1 Glutathione S-transferase-like protein [Giardia muris]